MAKKTKSSNGTISVNTTNVRNAASSLSSINNAMEDDFKSVKLAVSKMNAAWDGAASDSAMYQFYTIKSTYCGPNGRKAVMKRYIDFLNRQVATDYDTTENTNRQLASLFK